MAVTRMTNTPAPERPGDPELAEAARSFVEDPEPVEMTIRGVTYILEPEIAAAAVDVVARLESGTGVVVGSAEELLTTTQAGDLLGVSRTYVCQLIDQGLLDCTMRGTHRRVRLDAVQRYGAVMRQRRQAALDEIAEITRAVGGYDDGF